MKNGHQNVIKNNVILLAVSLFLAANFYVVCGVNSDDAGTYVWLREQFDLGGVHHSLKEYLNPWCLIAVVLYRLSIGNTGASMLAWCYSIWIFLCSFLTLKISLKRCLYGQCKNSWLIFGAAFIMMPSANVNRYHLPTIFAALLLLWAVDEFFSTRKKRALVAAVIYALYTFMFTADKALLIMEIAAPIGLNAVIWCMQKKERHKYLLAGIGVIAFLAACVRIISDAFSFDIAGSWGGYGGEDYMFWTDIQTLFEKNIPSFFAALMNQYNIPAGGGLIQFLSFYWIIRLVIVGIMLTAFVSRCRDILKKGIENVHIVDALSVFAAISLVGVNILNGIAEAYSVYNQPISRYAGLAWYLLIIIFIRWVDEQYSSFYITIKNSNITSGFAIGMILILLIMGYSQPIYKGREALVSEACQPQLDFLKKHGDEYRYGLASYWKSNPITAVSNGEYTICGGWVDEVADDLYLRATSGMCEYEDGSNYFNIMISYIDNSMTIDEENIELLRGGYTDKIEIEDAIYYLYDYDIRWDDRLIMEAVGTDYELMDAIQYQFEFPVGTNRIVMDVMNSENFELSIEDNEDVSSVSVQKISDSKIYVDLVCTQNTTVAFNVARKADELTTIHKIVLRRVRAAIELDSNEIFLKPGSYVVTFAGNGLHDAQAAFEGDNISVNRLTDGRIKNRYQVDINTAQTIKYNITGKNASVDKVYYEDAVLFGDGQ